MALTFGTRQTMQQMHEQELTGQGYRPNLGAARQAGMGAGLAAANQQGITNPYAAARVAAQAGGQAAMANQAQTAQVNQQLRSNALQRQWQEDQANQQRADRFIGMGLNAAGSAMSMFMSDEESKTAIRDASRAIDEFLGSIDPSTFEYRNPSAPGAAAGRRAGVMAQDLERTEVGRTMVERGADGMRRVNPAAAMSTLLAAQARLNARLEALEGGGRGGAAAGRPGASVGGGSSSERTRVQAPSVAPGASVANSVDGGMESQRRAAPQRVDPRDPRYLMAVGQMGSRVINGHMGQERAYQEGVARMQQGSADLLRQREEEERARREGAHQAELLRLQQVPMSPDPAPPRTPPFVAYNPAPMSDGQRLGPLVRPQEPQGVPFFLQRR